MSEAFLAVDDARGRSRSARSRAARCRARPGRRRARRGDGVPRARSQAELGLKVLTVIGNRPQFVKAAAVSRPLRAEHEEVLVHTGQHHDDELSTVFFEELRHPAAGDRARHPRRDEHVADRADARRRSSRCVARRRGPTSCSSTATRTRRSPAAWRRRRRGVPVAHVEAGMRSFDRAHARGAQPRARRPPQSTCCSRPSPTAVENLRGRARRRARRARRRRHGRHGATRSSRVARDTPLPRVVPAASSCSPPRTAPATSTTPTRLRALVDLLRAVPQPVVLPLHPRTRARLEAAGLLDEVERAPVRPAAARLPRLHRAARSRARAVLTDSGGVQKEAYLAGVPCVTLRDTTEWVETVEAGWNVLVDLDADAALARAGARAAGRAPAALRRRRRRASASSRRSRPSDPPDLGTPSKRAASRTPRPSTIARRAGQVGRGERARTRRGRPARSPRRPAPPSHGSKPAAAQLVVACRAGRRTPAARRARPSSSRSAQRAAERRLLHAAAVGDAEDEHGLPGDVAEQVDRVGGHRLVDLARDARAAARRARPRGRSAGRPGCSGRRRRRRGGGCG